MSTTTPPPSGAPIDSTPPPPAGVPVEPAAPAPEPSARRWTGLDILLVVIAAVLGLVLALVLWITVSWAVQNAQAAEARIGTAVEAQELLEGDCVRDFRRGVTSLLTEYEVVDCAAPHAAELIDIAEFGDDFDGYLSEQAASELAETVCSANMRYRLNLDEAVDDLPDAMLFGVYQSRATWGGGNTQFQCFLLNRDGAPLEGSYFVDSQIG